MYRSRAFTLVELLMVIIIIGLLMALLLPALGVARRTARQRKNDTQVRGIHQAMVSFSEGNRGFYPGVRSNNTLVGTGNGDVEIQTNPSGAVAGRKGNFVAVRHEILFDGTYVSGEFAISPEEDKTEWTTGAVDQRHYSYAMLQIHYLGAGGGFAPNIGAARNEEWRNTLNSKAVVIADRNVNATNPIGGTSGNVDVAASVHTGPNSPVPTNCAPAMKCKWHGSVGYNDGRVEFGTTQKLALKYGSNQLIEEDNLFKVDDGPPGDTLDNALLVYEK